MVGSSSSSEPSRFYPATKSAAAVCCGLIARAENPLFRCGRSESRIRIRHLATAWRHRRDSARLRKPRLSYKMYVDKLMKMKTGRQSKHNGTHSLTGSHAGNIGSMQQVICWIGKALIGCRFVMYISSLKPVSLPSSTCLILLKLPR